MNTELKRLHDEAVIYTVSLCGQEHTDGPRPFLEVFDEKFAQLIIEECVKVAKNPQWYSKNPSNDWRNPINHVCNAMKEHFGVEE